MRGGELIIGVSLRKAIFGPFRQVGDPFYDEANLGFFRLDFGQNWEFYPQGLLYELTCPWRYRVEPVYPDVGVEQGLIWEVAAQVAGIKTDAWKQLCEEKITDDQFEALTKALLLANIKDTPVPHVTVEELLAQRKKVLTEPVLR